LQFEIQKLKELDSQGIEPSFAREIRVDNVSFAYGNDDILKNISLQIKKNATIALVGESGSGKTTLANIISGLIPVKNGDILLDDLSYKDMNLKSFRQKVGYITQDAVVFNDTLFNNVTFWDEPSAANVARFDEVLKLTHLTEFVHHLPLKEQTVLGDHGILI